MRTSEITTTTEFNDSPRAREATSQVLPTQSSDCFLVRTTRLWTLRATSTLLMMEITGFKNSPYRELSCYLGEPANLEAACSTRSESGLTIMEISTLQILTTVVSKNSSPMAL